MFPEGQIAFDGHRLESKLPRGLKSSPFRPQTPDADKLGIEELHHPTVAARNLYHALVLGKIRLALLYECPEVVGFSVAPPGSGSFCVVHKQSRL